MQPLSQIRQIDYTVIFARNMDAMRHFYEAIMEFPLLRALSDRWIEYRVGPTTLALTAHGARFNDTPPEQGALSLQLAFRVPPQRHRWRSESGHNRKSTISWAGIGRLTMTIATSLLLVTFWAHGRAVARRCRGLLRLSFADHAGDPEWELRGRSFHKRQLPVGNVSRC